MCEILLCKVSLMEDYKLRAVQSKNAEEIIWTLQKGYCSG
jgi:hypothetical protein